MDTLMETLQKRTDKKLHTMMYQKITDLTEGVDIQQATSKLIQQFSKRCHDIRVVGEGTWDGRHNIYRFYLRPVPRTQEDRSPYYKFLYGEIYFGSDRSLYQEHVVGYRVQIEDVCRFLPMGIVNHQLYELCHLLVHITDDLREFSANMEFKARVSKLETLLQELYDVLEFSGEVTDVPSFTRFVKEHVTLDRWHFWYHRRKRAMVVSGYSETIESSIECVLRIHQGWYTRIKL